MPCGSEAFLGNFGSPPGTGNGSASSPPPALNDNRPAGDNLDTILFQLRQVTRERDELRKRLALASPGTTFDDCRPNSKASHDYERLKNQCMRAMADLQCLQNQHTKTLKRCEEAVKEADFYHMLHSRVLGDQSQLKEELEVLRRDHAQMVREHNHLKQSCEELRRLHSEDQKEVADMRLQQQEVMRENGSSEVLNKLYDTAMDKLEGVRKEYDSLSKRYGEKVANHNTDLSRLEQAEEENRRLQKQIDTLLKQRDKALHYQQQCSTSMRRFDLVQQELDKSSAQNKVLQREMERLQSEVTRCKNFQLKAVKDCEKYKEERDSVFNEYRLIMSERDQVIKELEKLQTALEAAQARLKNTSSERMVASEETEALRQKQDSATLDIERVNKEMEGLRKQYEAMSQELKEATQEAEVAKCRRDWAFQERDKIVSERESIRTLCDNLRRERDRAVSDLADALRNLDDMRKQKNDTSRELKELKEKMESQLDKEARFCQLMAHSSHDSAIDTDSLEWETEVVEFEKDRDDMDLKALGFDIAEGVNDPYLPGDCGIFVTRVDRGSIADGRLRVNDWLLKLNDVDLTNKDRKQVVKAVLNGGGLINMVVRRRKSLGGRLVTPIHINLIGHKDSGIGLESGVFVTALVQGSPAAREGSLTVGDRLIAINGIALDNKSVTECETLLRNCRDYLSLSLMKFFPHSSSGQSIFESLRESTSNGRLSEVLSRNSLKHNSSTQTDIFCPDTGGGGSNVNIPGERRKGGAGEPEEGMGVYGDIRKPFSMGSLHSTSLRPSSDLGLGPPGRYGPSTTVERKQSGGTWPKMIVGVMSVAVDTTTAITPTQLSIFKSPKQRKSIFNPDAFKSRPETAPQCSKMEFLSPCQLVAHSPQPSKTESLSSSSTATPTPPTPPTRSDSFKFKHKPQSSSASDCTLTSDGGKGEAVAMVMGESSGERERDRNGNLYFLDGKVLTQRKSCDEDIGHTRGEEPEVKRPRPKSAPALRRRMTPQSITLPSFQVSFYSNDGHSPEPREMLRSSPNRSRRQSVGFIPTVYNGTLPAIHAYTHTILILYSTCLHTHTHTHTHNTHTVHAYTHTHTLMDFNSIPSGWSSNVQYRIERIKIPSTPRYPRSMLGSDRGSLSHSECSSPSLITPPHSPLNLETSSFASSQSQSSISTLPRISVNFLSSPLSPLPLLLQYNGINLRNATEQQARLIIGQQCDTITIMAQYNPHMYQLGNPSRSSSGLEPVSSQFTPQGSGATTPDIHSTIDTLSEQDEGTLTPSSKQTTPTTSPHKGSRKVCEPRVVTVRRAQGAELGLGLCGGNLRGVYVESLEEDSPARGQEGLQPGDLILEYGSVNMKNKTVEEMYVEMLKPAETVTLRVQQRPDDFNMVKGTPGDGFYIRALYERTAEAEMDLSFQKDDILYVDDTLPKGCFGSWMVWQLDENAQRIQRGQIPSKYMMDQEFYRRHSMTELKDDKDSKSLSAAARRSFFRRKNKHKRSGSKDCKELVAQDAISTDSIPFLEDCVSLAYQRVQKVVCVSSRPVVILGPLSDPVKDMLVKESPGKFCRCVLEVMKASQQAIERGVKDCLFIDYKRRSGHFDVTTVASIKEITEKDCHCLLDIAPHAIERLHSVHIYPIVIFIRYKNAKQIKKLLWVCVCAMVPRVSN
uniref:Discs, large homolog 5a (Drosophila) n=1 Tax=Hucho hucho TaxID=62062 RepID=A0A4W5RDW6_9TELE